MMIKNSSDKLLNRAEKQFSVGDYKEALTTYGLILTESPNHAEAKIGAFLCDIGLDNDDEAQALFDYYTIIKNRDENPNQAIKDIINTIHSQKGFVQELMRPLEEDIMAIKYDDFIKTLNKNGNFKEALENMMFSTKLIISEKDEYIDFIIKLIENKFFSLAGSFLDSLVEHFSKDKDIIRLYQILKEKTS